MSWPCLAILVLMAEGVIAYYREQVTLTLHSAQR